MEENNGKEGFSYTYSKKQQDEIVSIRNKYIPKQEDKMDQLLRLDKSVSAKATIFSLIVGIVGTLLLGVGMCCTLVWAETAFVLGIFIGIPGIIAVLLAYPVYSYVIKSERERIAPEIIRLTNELMK